MKRLPLQALALPLLLAFAAPSRAQEAVPWGRGPLPVREAMLLEAPFLGFVPESPRVAPRGEITLAAQVLTANTYIRNGGIDERLADLEAGRPQQEGYGILADGEATIVRLDTGFGLGARSELRVSLPVILFSGGILDGVIDLTHDTFGLPDGGRSGAPDGRFDAAIVGDGGAWGVPGTPGMERSAGIGDAVFEGRFALGPKAASVGSSLSVLLKAPTGDADAGRGSGEPDGGLLLALSGRAGKNGFVYGNAAAFLLGDPGDRGIRVRSPFHAMIGYEHRFDPRWSLLAQVHGATSIWPSADGVHSDRPRAELSAGFRWGMGGEEGRTEIHAGFLQNLTTHDNDADFTLFFGTSWRP